MNRIVIVGILLALFVALAHGAPRPTSDKQLSFDTDVDGVEVVPRSRGFVQRIFDFIKNIFGFENRRTVVRNDGTVVEIEPENEGFLSRIARRLLGLVSRVIGTFTGSDDVDRVVPLPNDDSRYRVNEIERELVRLNKRQEASNVVLS